MVWKPTSDASTLDMDVLFSQSRYEEQGSGDYLNAPLNKEEYEAFIEALTTADRVVLKDFEGGDLFQACQPAEEVARTGKDAIRFGAMKPVGLTDPRTGRRPLDIGTSGNLGLDKLGKLDAVDRQGTTGGRA